MRQYPDMEPEFPSKPKRGNNNGGQFVKRIPINSDDDSFDELPKVVSKRPPRHQLGPETTLAEFMVARGKLMGQEPDMEPRLLQAYKKACDDFMAHPDANLLHRPVQVSFQPPEEEQRGEDNEDEDEDEYEEQWRQQQQAKKKKANSSKMKMEFSVSADSQERVTRRGSGNRQKLARSEHVEDWSDDYDEYEEYQGQDRRTRQ